MHRVSGMLQWFAAQPSEQALQVLTDALLELGDPRGQLQIASTPKERRVALDACIDRARSRLGAVDSLRFEHGLVARVAMNLLAAGALSPAALADEPMMVLSLQLPTSPAPEEHEETFDLAGFESTMATLHDALAGLRGLHLERVEAAQWPAVLALVESARPKLLWVPLIDARVPARAWPWLEALAVTVYDDRLLVEWLEQTPELRALHLTPTCSLPEQVWEHPRLVHLDLRGRVLTRPERERLERWRAAPGRSVRHEEFSLRAPNPIWDDFGDAGETWPSAGDTRRAAFAPNAGRTFVLARGTQVRAYRDDQPWQAITTAEPLVAVAAGEMDVLLGRDDHRVEAWTIETGERVQVIDAPGKIRSLDVLGEDFLVVYEGGWIARIDATEQSGHEEVAAAVLCDGGVAWADGAVVSTPARAWELDGPVLALAADGGRIAAIAGTRVWLLETDAVTLLGRRSQDCRAAIAFAGGTCAWLESPSTVAVRRGETVVRTIYPPTYSGGLTGALRVADLDVATDGVVVVALENGGANLLLPDSALKVDPFPGEPDGTWIFIHNNQILIASVTATP